MKLPKILEDKTKYLVLAVSCGVDSMCLLDLLEKEGYNVVIAHVNHHMRKQSEIEESFIKDYALNKGLKIEILSFYPKDKANFQAEARKARYSFFYDVCKKYNASYLLTAHHADDNLETILLRLIKGSNLYGYGGISYITPLKDIKIIRPLLQFTKEQILDYAKENKLTYFDDSSNFTNDYLRNRIRNQILPLLKEENPNLLNNIKNYSTILKESFSFIRNQSINYLEEHDNIIDVDSFKLLDIALQKDIICYLLEINLIKHNNNLINDIRNNLCTYQAQFDLSLPNDYLFKKRYQKAFIAKKESIKLVNQKLNLNETVKFNNIYFTLTLDKPKNNVISIKICYNYLKLPLTIRTKEDGDFIKLIYGTKKLKSLFIDRKLTKEEREQIPIITDSNNNILLVYGLINSKLIKEGEDVMYLSCEENYEK